MKKLKKTTGESVSSQIILLAERTLVYKVQMELRSSMNLEMSVIINVVVIYNCNEQHQIKCVVAIINRGYGYPLAIVFLGGMKYCECQTKTHLAMSSEK